jgi:plasmid stabilization system protein ParE
VKVRYTAKALNQLDEIFSYIAEQNPGAAKRVKVKIKGAIKRLGRHPLQRSPD